MSKEISKSPEMLQKEARIKKLHQQIKKERTTLKRLKTRLKNTKQDITDIQRNMFSNVMRTMEKMEVLKSEIITLLEACKKFKEIEASDREQIDFLINDIEEMTEGMDFDNFNEKQAHPEFEEEQRAKMNDIFQQFQVKPAAEEQKNIRKVFINLSTNFHPDKARNDQERKDYHSLMQEINGAYQSGDIDKLLELESIYLSDKIADFTNKAVTVDMLTQEIDRLTRDLKFIKNQVKRVSTEVKTLRKSDLGNMLTEINRAEKYGMGIEEMTEDVDAHLERLEKLTEVLQECVKQESMDPMKEMSDSLSSMDLEDLIQAADMGDEDFMMENFFENLFSEAPQPVKNPKIPIGTSVQIKENIPYPYVIGLSLKGWQGRVSDVYKIEKEVIYQIELDSISLKSFSKALVEDLIEEEMNFNTIEVNFSNLKKVPPRDTAEEALSTYRKMFHGKRWQHLNKKSKASMQAIMLKFPEKSDEYNWKHWLNRNLKFPFTATIIGHYNDPPGRSVTVTKIDKWHDIGGLLVIIDKGSFVIDHPLYDISTNDKFRNVLELYHEWFEMIFY